jgi:transcriptional regulator with XRE-family HTH domain
LRRFPALQRAIVGVLKSAREKAGLSQRALSRALDEDETFIHTIENMRRDISVAEFIALAEELDLTPAELIGRIRR